MILGIGTDIVDVNRIARMVEQYEGRFLEKILVPTEVEACAESSNRIQRIAARFAAKEALVKAMGTGMCAEINYRHIEILNGKLGEPLLRLHGSAEEMQKKRGISRIHLSMSHTEKYATAMVVLEN